MKLLVIIVAFKGDDFLKVSLPKLRHPEITVFIRDNGASLGTNRLARDILGDAAHVELGANLGFGRGNNRGFSFGLRHGFDWFFLLNQDAWVDGDELVDWVRGIGVDQAPAIHCPIQLNWDGEGANSNFEDRYAPGWQRATKAFDVSFVNAAAWLISRETLMAQGGFNPLFHMYGEDREWVSRLHRRGGSVWVHPEISVRHKSNVSKKSSNLFWLSWTKTFWQEVDAYFNGQDRLESDPRHGFGKRALRRVFRREFALLTISGVQFLTELKLFIHLGRNLELWKGTKVTMRKQLLESKL